MFIPDHPNERGSNKYPGSIAKNLIPYEINAMYIMTIRNVYITTTYCNLHSA